MMVPIIFGCVLLFIVGSMTYAYAFRGQIRYESVSEYLRKGWPIFTPLNCLLYILTQRRARKHIMKMAQFEELKPLEDNWETIRDEAVKLQEQGFFDQIKDPKSGSYYDIGFRTFYKYGWSKFYLKWYGYTHASAQKHCPKTLEILKTVPSVKGAMFSILPEGSKLTRHLDPIASSLRYHLGLATPNDDQCFINVDGEDYSWRDGEPFLFDETYIHFARNDAKGYRLILMCDVARPLNPIGKVINWFTQIFLKLTVVPNMEGDRKGLANAIFSSVAPLIARSKELKQRSRTKYLILKHGINLTLLLLLLLILVGLIKLGVWLFSLI